MLVAYLAAMLVAFAVAARLAPAHPILVAAVADVAATVVVFASSVLLDNSSVYDPYWSVAPPFVAAYWTARGELGLRQLVLLALILAWAVRLTVNWARRWDGPTDEDFRYREIRGTTGRGYWPASFVSIHLMPTIWVFLGLLPLYPALAQTSALGILDGLACLVTATAIAIETIADEQLRRFLRSPREPGAALASGLWARCRHPNYFGEVTFWWGLYLFGVAARPAWAWSVVGPLSITALFLSVSVPWMDRHMLARHSDWARRAKGLPALLPWGRRGPAP